MQTGFSHPYRPWLPARPACRTKASRLVNRRRPVLAAARQAAPERAGSQFQQEHLTVQQSLGEGNFGQVFLGVLRGEDGTRQQVVLKRVKGSVQGATEIHEMEHQLSAYASRAAPASVAAFLGHCRVSEPRQKLTRGLWLVWDFQGSQTLSHFLQRRDCLRALAGELGVEEGAMVPTVMQHLFQCLEALHASGVVHRDVKPSNLLLCERDRRFKLIDLGAACDLRTGTNYHPTETILDPCYCPPEQYVLPTDAPYLSRHAAPLALAVSPLLWARHRPDCFDTYSAGITLLQLALPPLRKMTRLRQFRDELARCGHDLAEWRARYGAGLGAGQAAALDANGGEGWDLAQALLRPRRVETDEAGNVRFVGLAGAAPRLTAGAALRHPFLRRAAVPSPASAAEQPSPSRVASLLGALASGFSSSSSSTDDSTDEYLSPSANGSSGRTGSSGSNGKARKVTAAKPQQQAQQQGHARSSASGGLWGGLHNLLSSSAGKPASGSSGGNGNVSVNGNGKGNGNGRLSSGASRSKQPQTSLQQGGKRGLSPPPSHANGKGAAPTPALWAQLGSKLRSLEGLLRESESATEAQRAAVAALRAEVAAGRAPAGALAREEGALAVMQRGLQDSMREVAAVRTSAFKLLGSIGRATTPAAAAAAATGPKPAAAGLNNNSTSPATQRAAQQAGTGGRGEADRVPAGKAGSAGKEVQSSSAARENNSSGSGGQGSRGDGVSAMGQAATTAAAGAATSMLYAGLKFTGLALDAAATLARAAKADFERLQNEAEEGAEAQRAATIAYIEALQQLQPPLGAGASYDAVAPKLEGAVVFAALPERKRRQVFAAYVDALTGTQQAQQAVQGQQAAQLAVQHLQHEAQRAATQRQAQQAEREAKHATAWQREEGRRLAEAGFRQLLETQEGLVRGGATWQQLAAELAADARLKAVPAARQLEIFEEFAALLAELDAEQTQQQAAEGTAAVVPSVGEAATKAAATEPQFQQEQQGEEFSPLAAAAQQQLVQEFAVWVAPMATSNGALAVAVAAGTDSAARVPQLGSLPFAASSAAQQQPQAVGAAAVVTEATAAAAELVSHGQEAAVAAAATDVALPGWQRSLPLTNQQQQQPSMAMVQEPNATVVTVEEGSLVASAPLPAVAQGGGGGDMVGPATVGSLLTPQPGRLVATAGASVAGNAGLAERAERQQEVLPVWEGGSVEEAWEEEEEPWEEEGEAEGEEEEDNIIALAEEFDRLESKLRALRTVLYADPFDIPSLDNDDSVVEAAHDFCDGEALVGAQAE